MGYFPVRYVVIYEYKMFIRLATGHIACDRTQNKTNWKFSNEEEV